jgi:hypothetical protein
LLDALAADATSLGWSAPTGTEHVEYVCRATRGLRALAEAEVPAWMAHAYSQEYRDLKSRTNWEPLLIPPGCSPYRLGMLAPMIWPAEVALLAAGRRRTGRAEKLIRSCRRIQLAAARNCAPPVARVAYERDDGRTRLSIDLLRETELEREESWPLFWGYSLQGASRASGRPSREAATDLEGWDE